MLKVEICLSSLVLMCGQVWFWRRRDNILGYLQGGLVFASILVPVLGTTIIDNSDPAIVARYAHILVIGALAYAFGLCFGAPVGRQQRLPRLHFTRVLDPVPTVIIRRSRQVAVAALGALFLSFLLLGYVPFLAADRVGAKYGVGIYAAGLERGALVFHVALRLGSLVLPVMLALLLRRRRGVDIALAGALGLGLLVTLSRGSAFIGPLVFLVAWLIQRKWRPWQIVAVVCLAYVSATLVNEVVQVSRPIASASFATRAAASAPDISDQLGFLNGFEVTGSRHVGVKTLLSGLSVTRDKGEYSPASYALRIRTGLSDLSGLASGGLRLPAPMWGFASYGYTGVVVWSFVSGLFVGWGTTLLRRLLAPAEGQPGQILNLVLAWVFFQGTFAVFSEFYFPERAELVACGVALALCWVRRSRCATAEAEVGEAAVSSVVE